MILKTSIEKLMQRENLDGIVCEQVLDKILAVDASMNPLQMAAFFVLLRAKKETAEELSAIVKALQAKMLIVSTSYPVLDIVGTGGDACNTVNISTGSAILAASCGVKVAKHGNRAVSSRTGSADVLEALGIRIQLTAKQISQCIDEIGIGFCFAPNFNPMTEAFKTFRKELNVPTSMNILGPLLNPAKAAHLVLGVADKALVPVMADVLIHTGSKRSVIVHGSGLDEISTLGPATIIEVSGNEKHAYRLDPLDFGFARCSIKALQGGDAKRNAQLLIDALQAKKPGPLAETLILNAAVALYIYGKHASISEAVAAASDNLYAGRAFSLLSNWIEFSNAQ